MNAILYFDYSMAPFWPSYQNKIIGVLNRVARAVLLPEYGGSCFVCRGTWQHLQRQKTRFGMAFIETVSALMNATPDATSAGS